MVVEGKECTANVEGRCRGCSVDYDFGKGVLALLRWGGRRGGSGICRLCHESLGWCLIIVLGPRRGKNSPDERYERGRHFVSQLAKRETCVRDVSEGRRVAR